jgi:hypothetical protein
MPSYGQQVTIQYVAWNTSTNAGQTGDSGNHTLRWIKDGTEDTTTIPSATEIDSTNAPGVYKATITATQAQCQVGTLAGKSSTSNVAILPVTVTFENLPTAAPGASGGVPTLNSALNVPADVQTIKTQTVTCSGAVAVGAYVGEANLVATDSSGRVLLQPTQTGVTIPTVTTVTNQLTGAAIASAVWQDSTAGDFTASNSIGKSLYTSGVAPGGANGLFIAGTNAATTANITGNLSGNVTGSVGSVSGLTTTTIAAAILATPANLIATDSSGRVSLNLTQTIPTSNTAQTVGDSLNAARAQGFGKWVLSGTTLTLYAADGSTVVRTFTLDNSSAPTQRV